MQSGLLITEETILQHFTEGVAIVFVELRKELGYTSYESFAFDHEFPRAQYWRVETGKFNLTLRTLSKLLLIHKLTVEDFLVRLLEVVQREKLQSSI